MSADLRWGRYFCLQCFTCLFWCATDAGDLDVSFVPTGTGGYADLAEHVARFDLDGVVAPVAALLDIIRSKTAANRPKDQASLPILAELARQLGLLT